MLLKHINMIIKVNRLINGGEFMYRDDGKNENEKSSAECREIPMLFLMHQVLHMNMQYIIHLLEPMKINPGHAGIL